MYGYFLDSACSPKHLPEVQTSILQKKPSGQALGCGRNMAQSWRVTTLDISPGRSRLRVSSLQGTLAKQQSLLLNSLKDGIWKLGGKVLVSILNSALKQFFIPAAQGNKKCYQEQVLQFGGEEEFICSSTTAHPVLGECVVLKKKLIAHLGQQKWRNISAEQTSPEYPLPLPDKEKASLLQLSCYCLFWFLITLAK